MSCKPVAVQVHGQVLQDWQLAQLQPAAAGSSDNSDAPQDIMRRMDTFLAANWQQYASFVDDVLHKVGETSNLATPAHSCEAADVS